MISRRIAIALLLLVVTTYPAISSGQTVLPESRWINSERDFARSALKDFDADLLIVPLQGGENSFDPIERSLITRIVADRVMSSTELRVANPTLVLSDLGSHRSVYAKNDIQNLATHVKADLILEMRAEHNRNGSFSLDIAISTVGDETAIRKKSWPNLVYSDSYPPMFAIQGILSDLIEFIVEDSAREVTAERSIKFGAFEFPDSLEQLKSESTKSSLHSAAYLQLLGMLHPSAAFDEPRNHLFERSLVQLSKVPAADANKRYFMARAFAYLDRRPAAVVALGDPKTTHEKALLAALNGDLPALIEEVEKMGTSALDFMAWRDLLEVERRYGKRKEREIVKRFAERNLVWAPFIYRALRDTIRWSDFSAATIKMGLEQLVPNDTASLEALLDVASVTGKYPNDLELTRAVWRHIDAFGAEKFSTWGRQPENYLNVSELDILDLAKTLAVANQLRRVDDDLEKRDLPEVALRKIDEFDPLFSGHPAITLQKGRVLGKLEAGSSGAERSNLSEASATQFLRGLAWTGQMTADSAEAAISYNLHVGHSRSGIFKRRVSGSDFIGDNMIRYFEWPRARGWFQRMYKRYAGDDFLQSCIDYSWTAFSCLKWKIESLESKPNASESIRVELLAEYSHRFIGSSQRAEFEIASARQLENGDSDIAIFRAQIRNGNSDWPIYYALARALKRRGDYQAAQDVFLSYPGFSNISGDSAVANSNHAEYAGSMFYWVGQYELALPLLELAANSRTGSGASLSAGNRVSLITGNLEAAEAWTAARVRRYGSKYAIRDLQQILHIRGNSNLAWSIFDQVQSTKQGTHMWSGALVGHRLAGATTQDILEWIEASELRKNSVLRLGAPHGSMKLAARYLLLAGTMDRAPGPELANAISKFRFDRPTTYQLIRQWDNSGPEPKIRPIEYVTVDGQSLKHDELIPTPADGQKAKSRQQIDSRYEMLANAMAAFLGQDFDRSFEFFNEAAYYYYLDEFLPYYAFSAAAVGRAGHLRAALESREPALQKIRNEEKLDSSKLGYRFDEDLTYAVLESFEGHHESAIRMLKRAMNNRPYMEERSVYPYYQVVDLADRLYERTGIALYRDYALDLAKRHTVILPMYAWAYFVVAKYSESEFERLEVAASGLKLDPLSHRATLLPKELIEQSKRVLTDHGAPYLKRTVESPASDT